MEPPVHAHAEPDLPKQLALVLEVEPDGESHLWAENALNCNEALSLVAAAATYGRQRYPATPRPRGSLETTSPVAPSAA